MYDIFSGSTPSLHANEATKEFYVQEKGNEKRLQKLNN